MITPLLGSPLDHRLNILCGETFDDACEFELTDNEYRKAALAASEKSGAATDNPHYRGPAAKIPDVRPRVLIIGSRVEGRFHGPQRGCDAHRG